MGSSAYADRHAAIELAHGLWSVRRLGQRFVHLGKLAVVDDDYDSSASELRGLSEHICWHYCRRKAISRYDFHSSASEILHF